MNEKRSGKVWGKLVNENTLSKALKMFSRTSIYMSSVFCLSLESDGWFPRAWSNGMHQVIGFAWIVSQTWPSFLFEMKAVLTNTRYECVAEKIYHN